MPKRTSIFRRRSVKPSLFRASCAGVLTMLSGSAMPAPAQAPAFIASNIGWQLLGGKYGGKDFQPPPQGSPGAAGPVGAHPDHPHICNMCGGTPNLRIGNDRSPLLTQWAADEMKKTNQAILAGGVPFDPAARCWPAGVPAVVTFAIEPLYFAQAKGDVVMLYQRGQVARHVYMDRPHSARVKPSWYGESVGHYEGDTFVVDTIGLSDKSFVDVFNTPHTNALHVVERYKTIENGNLLQVVITVDDPGAFTKPWSAMKIHGQVSKPLEESICAENNGDLLNQGVRPLPVAERPDF